MFTKGSAENKKHKYTLRIWKTLPVLNKPSRFLKKKKKKLSYSFQVTNRMPFKNYHRGTSLVVQGLRLRVRNAGGLGSIPGQGTRSHVLQLKPSVAK